MGDELVPPSTPASPKPSPRSPRNERGNIVRGREIFNQGPKSLFPNIGDVVAVSSTRLHAGQVCVIRYRLMGATNFWRNEHPVLKNEREVVTWPISRKIL